ncbi:MAG: PIN domain-containing protein [Chloroflexota bacterium]|nr:PIN domain-containing protein [Chloroflexota bacterium]
MNLIDANVFIRYLIGDDLTKQRKSKELIDRIRTTQEEALTTGVIVHEVCYILSASTHYNLSHQDIRDRLYPILAMPGLSIADKGICLEALNIFATGEKIDFSDALLVASVRNGLAEGIYSFDRKLDNVPGSNRVAL